MNTMKFEINLKDHYSEHNLNSFFNLANLQNRIIKSFVDVDLLDAVVFWYTNVVRLKFHLKQFQFHHKLRQTAILHSEQMNRHNFFSHDNAFVAKYKTLTNRIDSVLDNNFQGFMYWGENIADCPVIEANKTFTIENSNGIQRLFSMEGKEIFPYSYNEFAKSVVVDWMNSPGHRENILNPDFVYLGCGCAKYEQQNSGYSLLYFKLTQNFGGRLIADNRIPYRINR